MLAPSDGGLILYQAYGNLYAMTGSLAMLTMDFSNAFNLVDKSALLHEQGDPLGPLLFALILHPLLHKIKDSCKLLFHAWYLDDGAFIGDSKELLEGLFPVDIRRPSSGVKLLGGAVSRDAYFISGLAMRRATNAVNLMGFLSQLHDPQSELLLLRSCMGIAKLFFGLRTCQPVNMEEAALLFDKGLRGSIENIVVCGGPFFGDLQWRLASLPIRFCGLGLYSAKLVLGYEDWTGAVTDINEDGFCHPIVTILLLPDFGGVTDGTRAKNPSSLSDIHARVFIDPYLLFRLIIPPRRFKKKSVKKIVEKHVAKAIEKYEKTRADSNNVGGSGSTNTGGTVVPEIHGCSYKTFMNGKPYSFKGTEGVVGLKRWFEKMGHVFEICKCAKDDKVKFAMCTFEGRALTWMEQELWTLTLKGDDIKAYSNRFHELVLMCPELVSTKSKKIEKYIRGFPERIKGNITSSNPATLHEAINIARELVEQSVQGKAARIGESNKRK
ncbi:hypothetical protein Tco_0579215 [Tanacetum coccineum]